MILNLLSWLVIGFMLVSTVRSNKVSVLLQFAYTTYFRNGIVPYLLAPVLVASVALIITGLNKITPDFMHYGWIHLLSSDKDSTNVGLSAVADIRAADGLLWQIAGVGLLAVLLLFLPKWAQLEEASYRRYHTSPSVIARKSVAFGLVHMVMGVSLNIALALAFTGLVYAIYYNLCWQSRRVEGLSHMFDAAEQRAFARVTAAHTVYNAFIVCWLAVFLLLRV